MVWTKEQWKQLNTAAIYSFEDNNVLRHNNKIFTICTVRLGWEFTSKQQFKCNMLTLLMANLAPAACPKCREARRRSKLQWGTLALFPHMYISLAAVGPSVQTSH
jgi:hypothetical protein